MKKNIYISILSLLCALPMSAQLNGSGFYRFRNAQNTSDYISLANDKFNFKTCIDDASGGFTNLASDAGKERALACASKYMQTDIHMVQDEQIIDPSSIIYAKKKVTVASDYDYNLVGQGTSILTLTTGTVSHPNSFLSPSATFSNINVNIQKSSGSGAETLYTAYILLQGTLDYIGTSTQSLGKRYFTDEDHVFNISESNSGSNAKWYIEPVSHFNVAPSVEYGGKYFTTLYVPFAFTLSNNVQKAYAVTSIDADGSVNIKEVAANGGTVPAGTPVILECTSNVASDCQLIPTGTPLFTAPVNVTNADAPAASTETAYTGTNILKGTYFCNTDGSLSYPKSSGTGTINANHFTAPTNPQKYVLGITASGKLGLVKATGTAMPANKAWLEYTGTAELVLPFSASKPGDVNRDGNVTIADVTALVDIILGKDPGPNYTYDHEAANVNGDSDITIADVTALVDIILGK